MNTYDSKECNKSLVVKRLTDGIERGNWRLSRHQEFDGITGSTTGIASFSERTEVFCDITGLPMCVAHIIDHLTSSKAMAEDNSSFAVILFKEIPVGKSSEDLPFSLLHYMLNDQLLMKEVSKDSYLLDAHTTLVKLHNQSRLGEEFESMIRNIRVQLYKYGIDLKKKDSLSGVAVDVLLAACLPAYDNQSLRDILFSLERLGVRSMLAEAKWTDEDDSIFASMVKEFYESENIREKNDKNLNQYIARKDEYFHFKLTKKNRKMRGVIENQSSYATKLLQSVQDL